MMMVTTYNKELKGLLINNKINEAESPLRDSLFNSVNYSRNDNIFFY